MSKKCTSPIAQKNLQILLAKLPKKVYNTNGMRNLIIVWRGPTRACEPCQVRKEAAISSSFCVGTSIE